MVSTLEALFVQNKRLAGDSQRLIPGLMYVKEPQVPAVSSPFHTINLCRHCITGRPVRCFAVRSWCDALGG